MTIRVLDCTLDCTINYVATTEKYGYILSNENEIKKDKELEGAHHIGLVQLPRKLKDSLSLFHQSKNVLEF